MYLYCIFYCEKKVLTNLYLWTGNPPAARKPCLSPCMERVIP